MFEYSAYRFSHSGYSHYVGRNYYTDQYVDWTLNEIDIDIVPLFNYYETSTIYCITVTHGQTLIEAIRQLIK